MYIVRDAGGLDRNNFFGTQIEEEKTKTFMTISRQIFPDVGKGGERNIRNHVLTMPQQGVAAS
jgi:hypothetical protein